MESFSHNYIWKSTMMDGSTPIRRYGDGPVEKEEKD